MQSETIRNELEAARSALDLFVSDGEGVERIADAARLCARSLHAGGKLLAIGNGGSCADAMHFAEELSGRYREDRPAIAALACTDPGHLTCTANDYGYDRVFARWIEAIARPGDVLIALSTSGNSANVVAAVEAAKARSCRVILLLGKNGGTLDNAGDMQWIVPGQTSDRIQEIHMLILHCLVGAIEREVAAG